MKVYTSPKLAVFGFLAQDVIALSNVNGAKIEIATQDIADPSTMGQYFETFDAKNATYK